MRQRALVKTGLGAHGLYPSRDARRLYVSNRDEGTHLACSRSGAARVIAKWRLPGGGSPDMGGVSADGRALWLSGRYNGQVYEISTRNGPPAAPHHGGLGAARPVRLAAARPLLDRAHGDPALAC